MKIVKAMKEFCLNGKYYAEGDEVEVNNVEILIKLNEKGFITPQSPKDIQNFGKDIKVKISKKEVEE